MFNAIRENNLEYIREVIRPGNVNEYLNDQSLLTCAARYGNVQVCEFLISQGIKPKDLSGLRGRSPLPEACVYGQYDCARIIVNAFPHLVHVTDAWGENVLHDTCRLIFRGQNSVPVFCQIIDLLLSAGADLEKHDTRGFTPLALLMKHTFSCVNTKINQFRAVRFLLHRGAKLSKINTESSIICSDAFKYALHYVHVEKSVCVWILTCQRSQHVKRIIGKDMVRLVAEEILQ